MKKNNGFAIWTVAASVLIFFGAISFSACQNELLDSPSFQNRGSYSTGRVAAPTNLTATQGGFRSITIKWTAAKSAVFYNIYHSDTATGNFTFLEQTPDATCSYTTSADPDVKKYYKIQSVDTNGEVSEQYSQICFGTTLATPIITSIKQNAKGDAITVRWYKGVNCTTDTYLNDSLNYTIVLYNADGTQVLREETISAMDVKEAADTKYTFTNLTPNTKYKIQIKAYTKSAQDSKSTESSDKEDQSTAHSLIPAAPENFSVSKGTSKDSVTLSWELPKYAEIKSATAFETRPVYFKIYRKLESAPENAYEPIVTYLGTKAPTEDGSTKLEKTAIQFTKPAEESSATNDNIKVGESLAVSKTDSEGNEIKIIEVTYPSEVKETDPNYPDYIPGTKITLNDLTVSRGQKYSYRVQSFIDDNGKKNVTSDESYSEETGWLINSPTVSVSSTYKEKPKKTEDEPTKIESFTVTLNFKFDDFDQPYNYIITETCQKMEKAETDGEDDKEISKEEQYFSNSSYSSMFPKIFEYIPEDDDKHYKKYSYKVSICGTSSEDISTAYYTAEVPGCVIVINDTSRIPNVDDFTIIDGYKDKFILSWTYNKDCKYTLTWENIDKNNNESPKQIEVLDNKFLESKLNNETGIVTFEHPANSGDKRKQYTLEANNGLEATKTPPNEYKTLGTPEPYFEPSYKSIKVIWKPVQKAAKYEITAKYKETSIEDKNISEIQTDENGNSYCIITEPYGKNEDETCRTTDAEISGQKIDFKIKAISENSEAEPTVSSDNFKIFTLGPGAIEHIESDNGNPKTVQGIFIEGLNDYISLRWNKVEGAKGYLIIRKKYSEKYYSDIKNKADIYYVEDKSISLIQDESTISAYCYQNGDEFYFKDNYKSAENYDNQYDIDQAQLKWGLPYGYTVIPVLQNTDFTIDDELKIQGTENSIAYTESSLEKVEKQSSTYGYGLALNASKATSESQVSLSWAAPYKTSQKPTIYCRGYNEANGSEWKKLDTSNSLSTAQISFPKDNGGTNPSNAYNLNPHKAYDFIVCYSPDSTDTIKVDSYFENYIASKKDSNNEKNNKGYILSLEAPAAKYGGIQNGDDYIKDNHYYYSENLSWKQYNPEEKRQGFDTVEISMLNTNKKDGWIPIVKLNPNDFSVLDKDIAPAEYDLFIEKTTNSDIAIMPKSIITEGGTNTTNGLLKVLRDAKHYYMIKASRTLIDSEGKKKTIEISKGEDGSIYAYRQITDEELVKATMLVIADAFNITPEGNTTNGAEGSFWWNGEYVRWSVPIRYALKMKINNYLYSWKNLPNQQLSVTPINNFIKITDLNESNEARGKASDGKPLFMCLKEDDNFSISKLIPLTIENTHIPLSSYSGTVNFATSDTQFSVTVEHNGSQTFKKDVSGDEVRKWFPAKIGNNAYIGDTAEYWWE